MAAAPSLNESTGDLLCVILDLNPLTWGLSAVPTPEGDFLTLESALDQILIFCNAHLSLRHENQLAVFAAGFGKSRMLFSSSLTPLTSSTATSVRKDSNAYQQFSLADEKIAEGIKDVMKDVPTEEEIEEGDDGGGRGKREVKLVSALAMALCHINRLSASSTSSHTTSLSKPKARILILSVTEDASSQYVPIMNCIFSAQKVSIPIDVCKIYGPDAVFLQQACHLTQGSYYKIRNRAGLLQYLMMVFLPGPAARRNLVLPTQDHVDLRAACFCHRKIIDIGYVCSVCLSIFCNPLPVCTTCRTKFPLATLKRLGFGARPPAATNGSGNGVQRVKKRKLPTDGDASVSSSRGGTPGVG